MTPVRLGEEDIARMGDLCDAEIAAYTRLVELAEKKKGALLVGDLSRLEGIVAQEEAALRELALLEQERHGLQGRLASLLGLEPAELTLRHFTGYLREPERERFRRRGRALRAVMEEVQRYNEINGQLIEQSLSYINFSLDALTGRDRAPYGPGGQMRERAGARHLINRRA